MLKQTIRADLVKAMKEGEEITVSTLRMLNAAMVNKEKEKRAKIAKSELGLSENDLVKKSELTDEEIIEVVFSEVKKREEAALGFEKGRRIDLADKERKEKGTLKKYLPEQLSEEAVVELVKEALAKTGAKEMKDMGKVMVELMPKVKGKADGGMVSRIVKEYLSREEHD